MYYFYSKNYSVAIRIRHIIISFLDLLFPNLCVVCGETLLQNETQICLKCYNDIPRTGYHLERNNKVEKLFWGKVPIEFGTSYFFFQKGSVFQKVLHQLKYKNNREIGEVLGRYAGIDLCESIDFRNIEIVIPVPLHKKKHRKRGYNQSELIARGLSTALGKPLVSNALIRAIANPTQTNKTVYERYENTKEVFRVVNTQSIVNKHVLLVDDVLTTGATLEGCIQELRKVDGVTVSVFTLAVATR